MPKGEQRGNREAKKPKPQDNRCRAVHEGDSRIKRRIQEVGSSKMMRASESSSPSGETRLATGQCETWLGFAYQPGPWRR